MEKKKNSTSIAFRAIYINPRLVFLTFIPMYIPYITKMKYC